MTKFPHGWTEETRSINAEETLIGDGGTGNVEGWPQD